MFRHVVFFALALILSWPRGLSARESDGPPISITSPDAGTTFAYATVKSRSLAWNKKGQVLIALVTFTDSQQNSGQPNDDPHQFRLPGVTFDETKGVFFATSAKGEMIPVAHIRKTLFIKSIETTPNAVVRIQYPRGNIAVILEAISPNDPAMHAPPSDTSPDDTHKVDINKILN